MRSSMMSLLAVFLFLLISNNGMATGEISLEGMDTPNDKGESITLKWEFKDKSLLDKATAIEIFRKGSEDSEAIRVKELAIRSVKLADSEKLKNKTDYFYYMVLKDLKGNVLFKSESFGPFQAYPQWFNFKKTSTLIYSVLAIFFILFFIKLAKSGRSLYIRPLAGVKAIEDAIGRATEMGKPCIYSAGIGMIEEVATLASISILSKISETVAEYGSRMIVPNFDPIVYSVTDEVIKNAYLKVGRPDAYKSEDVYFLTQRQFAYASGISGLMAREKPAANFFLGYFMAESLILAEAGSMTGAIQIAGTDSISQIPFFIVACDYTLIGEELYAAGAIMGDDAGLRGGLKGQDYMKLIAMLSIFILFFAKLFGVKGIDTLLTGGN